MGSNSTHPNGRGKIFDDLTFEYLPIPEIAKTREEVPTYRELGFSHVKYPDILVHLDPGFQSFTYGHVTRGFGDIRSLLRLGKNDMLFFYATLQKREGWISCIIGYFGSLKVYDCRKLARMEILRLRSKGFANNAHLKRSNPTVDLLIKAGKNSRLLQRAFPLSEDNDPLSLRKSLRDIIWTPTGKRIKSGTPWFRWTLYCKDSDQLLSMLREKDCL